VNTLPTMNQLMPMLPELVLAIGAMALLMIGVIAEKSTGPLVNVLSTFLLIAAAVIVYTAAPGRHVLFDGSFVVDEFARFLKVLALLGAAV
jgi:NADH-quinone oxidoreductase subunit N